MRNIKNGLADSSIANTDMWKKQLPTELNVTCFDKKKNKITAQDKKKPSNNKKKPFKMKSFRGTADSIVTA